MVSSWLKYASITAIVPLSLYTGFLALLTTKWFQAHAVYLHALQMTWFKNLDTPEVFGFLHNQVTPFRISNGDSDDLYAWHVLPVELYRKHEAQLLAEASGSVSDFTTRIAFKLLRDDPESRLVIHMHGAGGTVGSGYRVPNYKALSAGQPQNIHVLTFDYRGFGRSPGNPSEPGIIKDALAVVEWALQVAKIDPSRILIFSQSLGTAVNIAVAEHYVQQQPSTSFAGHILVAPFVDAPTLVSTYSIAGTIPLLGPLASFPALFDYLRSFLRDKWSTKDRIAKYVRINEAQKQQYQITIIHAEDDWDVPWHHTPTLFWHAANETLQNGVSLQEMEEIKSKSRVDMGSGGSVVEWKSDHGTIREEILKYGLHDVIMGNPIISLAVMRIFEGQDRSSSL